MFSFISRHVLFPIHERILGRSTVRFARELKWSQWFSPDEVRRYQQQKLAAMLLHAESVIPFYRRRLRDEGISLGTSNPVDALLQLPFLTKDEIRGARSDMIWHQAPGGVFQHNTGGSTGEPLQFHVDRRRQAYDQAARIRAHGWFNVCVGDREIFLWGAPNENSRTGSIKRFRDAAFNQRLLNAFDMSAQRMDQYLDAWDRFRPVSLFGYPSSIARLVRHAKSRGRRLDTRSLRAVFVTGETLDPSDRAEIASYFGVPLANEYGSRDAGFIAHECPKGRSHVTAENVIVEIVRDGVPVPAGCDGEIVITQLDNFAMPLIRYRTGDLGRLAAGRCECGRGLPILDAVLGRTTDFLHLPDGTVRHALSIIYPLRTLPGIRQFRVAQSVDYSVTIDVVRDDRDARITLDAVRGGVRPILGDDLTVRVRWVDRIEPSPSGKHRYVTSEVGRDAARPQIEVPTP